MRRLHATEVTGFYQVRRFCGRLPILSPYPTRGWDYCCLIEEGLKPWTLQVKALP